MVTIHFISALPGISVNQLNALQKNLINYANGSIPLWPGYPPFPIHPNMGELSVAIKEEAWSDIKYVYSSGGDRFVSIWVTPIDEVTAPFGSTLLAEAFTDGPDYRLWSKAHVGAWPRIHP